MQDSWMSIMKMPNVQQNWDNWIHSIQNLWLLMSRFQSYFKIKTSLLTTIYFLDIHSFLSHPKIGYNNSITLPQLSIFFILFGCVSLTSLANCRYWPLVVSIWEVHLHSTPNSSQVLMKVGYKYFSLPWSMVGNKWWRAWSPKWVITKSGELFMSFLSDTASIWNTPKSISSFGLKNSGNLMKYMGVGRLHPKKDLQMLVMRKA